jgi:PAS domain S-box-containing protein
VDKLNTRLNDLISENRQLRERLEEVEELVDAIRRGEVDAVVVSGARQEMVYTLKGADHTYRILIETMDEGAVILSDAGTILYCNRRFAQLLGKPIATIIGGSARDFFVSEDEERFRNMHRRVFELDSSTPAVMDPESGARFKTEMSFKTGNGNMPALISFNPLPMEDMKVVCMVVTDLTDLKQSQNTMKAYSEKLFRKNIELKQRAEQLARLSGELTMAEQRERKRLSKILHDGLQQHLAAAKLQVGGMAHQIDDFELKDSAFEIEEMLAESIRIARSLSTDLSPPILHAAGITAGLEWLTRWMADMHGFTVDLGFDTDAVNLNDDIKILLFEAVRELLFNAVKHSEVKRAAIRLETLAGSRVKIVVSDEGRGFDPCQVQQAQGNQGGLGLFSIRERIGLIGGTFTIDSTPGSGCRFTLIVPESMGVVEAMYTEATTEEEEALGMAARDDRGPLIRVLLADDHTLFRDGIARLLNKEPNIQVVGQAANGRAAIELAQKLSPHVILMDVSMPELDGVQATRIIHQQAPHIRIIGLSMYEDEERSQVMRAAGAVGYKTKTCPAAELIEAVLPKPARGELV